MFRINSQSTPQPVQAATTGGAAQPASNSLEGLMASLEQAIQRLMQMQGGQQPGGGDRMEPAPHHQAHHHHHHHHQHQQPPVAQPPVTKPPVVAQPQPQPPVAKPPVVQPQPPVAQPPIIRFPPIVVGGPTGGPVGGPVIKLPETPGGPGVPQAMGDESGGIVRKGLAGGTVGT